MDLLFVDNIKQIMLINWHVGAAMAADSFGFAALQNFCEGVCVVLRVRKVTIMMLSTI